MSNAASTTEFARLLADARGGCLDALGELFKRVRPYLLSIADQELADDLRAKGGGSDVVQESFLDAQQLLRRFTGDTQGEFQAWLRTILLHKLDHFRRQYRQTAKRQLDRELSLDAGSASGGWGDRLAGSDLTPSHTAVRKEEAETVQQAMARLSAHYQEVLRLRTWDGLSFAEVGARMGRTEDAARILWGRAIDRLRRELEAQS